MALGIFFKLVGVKLFILTGLFRWSEEKSSDLYKPPDNPIAFPESNIENYRTQQTINTIISKLNSTLSSIPTKLNSTLTSIPTKLSSTLNSVLTTINSTLTAIFSLITSLTSSLGGLGSLFSKPSRGGGGGSGGGFLSSILCKLNGTGIDLGGDLLSSIFDKGSIGGPCNPADVLLLANIPGIFIVVPLVILGISILVGAIAAVIIAIGGLGEHITDHIYEETDFANMDTSKIDATALINDSHGKLQPQSLSLFPPTASNYAPSSSNSKPWIYSSVDSLNKDFNKAYDKFSIMSQQQPLSPTNAGYFEQSDYNLHHSPHWSSNHARENRDKHKGTS